MANTNLMMLGPPGAGKGTQAQRLSEAWEVPHVSTGDMLRGARRQGSDLGRKAAEYMDAGDLVPDDVVTGIVRHRLDQADAEHGFILDGFPRTVAQAQSLDAMGVALDAVVNLDVDKAEVIRRLGGRLTCPECGATFQSSAQSGADGAGDQHRNCDNCGHRLVKRPDDRPEAIQQRLDAYREQTSPLITYYRSQGLLVDVDGRAAPEAVFGRIVDAISAD